MTYAVRLLAPLLCLVVLLQVACAGGEGDTTPTIAPTVGITATPTEEPSLAPSPEPTPTATAPATPTPSPAPTPPPEAPSAAPIQVDPEVTSLGESSMLPSLVPDGVLNLDPINLAQGLGMAAPTCAEFVLYLSWQVRQPYPPTGVDLEFYWTRMGGTELFAEGPSGQATRGCGAIQVVNNSDVEVTAEIVYVIGQLSP